VISFGSSGHFAELALDAAKGTHIAKANIAAGEMVDGKFRVYDVYGFEDVVITSAAVDGSTEMTLHTVSFDFAEFGHQHSDYSAAGVKLSPVETGWNFKASAPGPVSFAAPQPPQDIAQALDPEVNLGYFVKFEGIGDWLRVEDFDFSLASTSSAVPTGGIGAGKATFEDVVLRLGSSKEIVTLTSKLLAGAHIKKVEVDTYQEIDGKLQVLDQYDFTDATVTQLTDEGGNDNVLSFAFGKVSLAHHLYDQDGTSHGQVPFVWDLAADRAV
jgi:type VI protein secretion system component Hcp